MGMTLALRPGQDDDVGEDKQDNHHISLLFCGILTHTIAIPKPKRTRSNRSKPTKNPTRAGRAIEPRND